MISVSTPRWEKRSSRKSVPTSTPPRTQRWLTVSLVLVIVATPLLEFTGLPRIFFSLVTMAVIFAAVYAVSWNSARLAVGLVLALPAVISFWSEWLRGTQLLTLMNVGCRIVFLTYTTVTILQFVFRSRRITTNELFGAINVYILTGMTFGFIYFFLECSHPGSFRLPTDQRDAAAFMYYSFSTLGTLGIGDIVPLASLARSLTIVELMMGVLYVAVLIGHLVGHRRHASGVHIERVTSASPASYLVGRNWGLPKYSALLLVLLTTLLNYATSVYAVSLRMPFYLDSWATSLGTIVGGLWVGLVGGVLYNVLMAVSHWGIHAVVWALSSMLIAVCSWFFWNRGWINIHRPVQLVGAGVCIGILNSLLVMLVQAILGTDAILDTTTLRADLIAVFHDVALAKYGEQLFVEIMDKTVSLAMAAVSLFAVGELVRLRVKKAD